MTQSARKKYRQSKKTVFLTRLFPLAVLLCLLLLLLWQSSMVGDRLRQTLSLCGRALVPSLFPFLILSELMLSLGLSEDAGRFVPAPVRRFLGLSEGGSAALLLGMLCGFPIGARILKRLYEEGLIPSEEAQYALPLCSIPSPAFLVGSVGMGLFDSAKAGFLLYGSVILASLVASFLLRLGRSNPPTQTVSAPSPPPRPCSALLFTEAVMASMEGMIRVCAFVLTFSCVGALLDCMLAWLPIRFPSVFSSLLYGTLEMTGGIFSLSALPSSQALPAVALLSGWSGLSVHAQLFSLCGHLFSFRTYWQTKLLCAVLCPLLVLLGLFLFS